EQGRRLAWPVGRGCLLRCRVLEGCVLREHRPLSPAEAGDLPRGGFRWFDHRPAQPDMVAGIQICVCRRHPRANLRCSHRNDLEPRFTRLVATRVLRGSRPAARFPFRLVVGLEPRTKYKENLLSASQSSTPKEKKDEETVTVSKAQLDALLARIDKLE